MSATTLAGPTEPVPGASARTRRPRATGLVLLLVPVLAVATLGACAPSEDPAPRAEVTLPEATDVPTDPVPAPGTVVDPGAQLVSPFGDVPVRTADEQAAAAPPAPTGLSVPSVGVEMSVVPVGVEDEGSMGLPASVYEAGWYQFGPAPASDSGTTVMASHVDSAAEGLGPFAALVDVTAGAAITVVDAAGVSHAYTVSAVERVSKAEVRLDDVFVRDGERRLVLVTCGGDFDRSIGHYVDNVIVTAVPAA